MEEKLKKIKNKKAKIAMSIMCFGVSAILITVLFIQVKTIEKVNETDIVNLREEELREEISTWKNKYDEVQEQLTDVNAKIEEYEKQISDSDKSELTINNELQKSEMLLGKTNVVGEGVIVTLTDNEYKITSSDLLVLVNELRFAGAEAISINDVRITTMSDIVDIANQYIIVKPNQRITSPYVIKAIGNKKYLMSTLSLRNSGFIDKYTNSGRDVKVEESDNVKISAYSWDINAEYMKED
jgi:uncharacterized protein YlxW (UPF0749 family)